MNDTSDFTQDPRQLRGSNHSGMRQFNERIVLQVIRHHGAMPKADVARLTQLSSQTVSIIVNRLLDEGLLLKQAPVRGKVGQPSVPMALNPDGAFSVGIQVGRREMELLVCDFVGQPRHRVQYQYPHPDPQQVLPLVVEGLARLKERMGVHWSRTVGIGLASPLSMHQWADVMGGEAAAALARWEHVDLQAQVQALSDLPVIFAKDTTAACVAELVQGRGRAVGNYLYVFVGTFVGGGLVLNGHIVPGARGNAGAIGSVPMGLAQAGPRPHQLLEEASGWQLEQALRQAGLDPLLTQDDAVLSPAYAHITQPWLQQASRALAMTVASAAALLDLDAVVLDGSLSRALVVALIESTQAQLAHYRFEGMHQPRVLVGAVGAHARALGGALLPLHTQFFPDKDIFLKQDLA